MHRVWKLYVFFGRCIARHQDSLPLFRSIRSGLKAALAFFVLAIIGYFSHEPLMLAPFAATSTLVFTQPHNQLSQPVNVIMGYLISTTIGLVFFNFISESWLVTPIALGLTISIMAIFRLTHAPATAVPVIIYIDHIRDFSFIVSPIFFGSMVIVISAILLHRIPPVREYPLHDRHLKKPLD